MGPTLVPHPPRKSSPAWHLVTDTERPILCHTPPADSCASLDSLSPACSLTLPTEGLHTPAVSGSLGTQQQKPDLSLAFRPQAQHFWIVARGNLWGHQRDVLMEYQPSCKVCDCLAHCSTCHTTFEHPLEIYGNKELFIIISRTYLHLHRNTKCSFPLTSKSNWFQDALGFRCSSLVSYLHGGVLRIPSIMPVTHHCICVDSV